MSSTLEFLPSILRGLWTTAAVAAASIAGCAIVSVLLGVARSSTSKATRTLSASAVELLRGASALIYLFWVFYALPAVPWAPQLSPVVASVLVLAFVGGSYGAEIVRSAIQAIPSGQKEAAIALGLSPYRTMTHVILPQSLSQIVPAFGSLAVDLVKWTSIVSFVGVQDVIYVANSVRTITYDTVTVYSIVALSYWCLCLATGFLFQAIERSLPLSRATRSAPGSTTNRARPGALLKKAEAVGQ
jgi:His/Glu/Gln/Arg/opine family amino acid ABC transporter permease subunit